MVLWLFSVEVFILGSGSFFPQWFSFIQLHESFDFSSLVLATPPQAGHSICVCVISSQFVGYFSNVPCYLTPLVSQSNQSVVSSLVFDNHIGVLFIRCTPSYLLFPSVLVLSEHQAALCQLRPPSADSQNHLMT